MIIYGKQIVLYVLEKHQDLIEEVFYQKRLIVNFFQDLQKLNKKNS